MDIVEGPGEVAVGLGFPGLAALSEHTGLVLSLGVRVHGMHLLVLLYKNNKTSQ
jgi:hypothetical protein